LRDLRLVVARTTFEVLCIDFAASLLVTAQCFYSKRKKLTQLAS
jgi:hypothetical protein